MSPAAAKRTPDADTELSAMLTDIPSDAARRLVVAAVSSFAARGYHATTTRDISSGAGMSPAAMYVHYPSKEDLLFVVSRVAHQSALNAIRLSAPEGADTVERLRAIVRDFVRWHAQHTALARVAQYELAALSPDHYAEIAAIRRETEAIVRAEIKRGRTSGDVIVRDVPTATRAIMSLGVDVARWFQSDGKLSADRLAEDFAELAVAMVTASSAVPRESHPTATVKRAPRPRTKHSELE